MRCPFCGHSDTKVVDSRLLGEGDQVRRRRECLDCAARFTTYETADLSLPRVIKRDGRREPFSDEKLRSGILKAIEKRPVATERIDESVDLIKRRVRQAGDRELDGRTIGGWVMEELRKLDQVAYVRFASVYRSFEDVRAFLDEIESLQNDLPPDLRDQQLALIPGSEDDTDAAVDARRRGRRRARRGADEGAAAADDES